MTILFEFLWQQSRHKLMVTYTNDVGMGLYLCLHIQFTNVVGLYLCIHVHMSCYCIRRAAAIPTIALSDVPRCACPPRSIGFSTSRIYPTRSPRRKCTISSANTAPFDRSECKFSGSHFKVIFVLRITNI